MRHGSFPPSPLAKYLVRPPEGNLTKLPRVGAGAAWMRGWGPCGRPPWPCLLGFPFLPLPSPTGGHTAPTPTRSRFRSRFLRLLLRLIPLGRPSYSPCQLYTLLHLIEKRF